jgi:uncharacterized protein YxeA
MVSDMKATTFILTITAVIIFSVTTEKADSTDPKNSCVQCHTNAKKIQSLYVPPKIEFKQDEGEG